MVSGAVGLRASRLPAPWGFTGLGDRVDLLDRASVGPSVVPACPWYLEDVSQVGVGQIQLGPFPSPPLRPALGLSSEGGRGGGDCPRDLSFPPSF